MGEELEILTVQILLLVKGQGLLPALDFLALWLLQHCSHHTFWDEDTHFWVCTDISWLNYSLTRSFFSLSVCVCSVDERMYACLNV